MFNNHTHSFTRAVLAGGLLSLTLAVADTQAAPRQAAQAAPAQAQPAQASPDAQLVAKIQKAIGDDKALAGYVQTLKIIANDGLVSLKGSVRTEEDKKALGAKADAIAGEKNVMNNLVIAPDAPKPQTN